MDRSDDPGSRQVYPAACPTRRDCEIVVNDDVGRAEALMSKYATAP